MQGGLITNPSVTCDAEDGLRTGLPNRGAVPERRGLLGRARTGGGAV